MASFSGYVTYIEYTAGSNKGQTHQGDVFNNPFKLGDVNPSYTSQNVVETVPTGATELTLAWTPVVEKVFDNEGTKCDVKVIKADGTVEYKDLIDGKVTGLAVGDRIAYVYNNTVIPQNDLPILNAQIKSIALTAKARRIAIYYSQIAAFQAKTDYGIDLADQLAEKAVGQLNYKLIVA